MKKRLFVMGIPGCTLVFGLVLMGCATSGILNRSVPMDQTCVIMNANELTAIDEEPILSTQGSYNLVIPAGEHWVRISGRRSLSTGANSYVSYRFIAVTVFNFEAGKKYSVRCIEPQLTYSNGILSTHSRGVTISGSYETLTVSTELEIIEKGKKITPTHIGFESQGNLYIGWLYEKNLYGGFGSRLGLSVIHRYLDMKIMGEAGIGLGAHFGGTFDFENADLPVHLSIPFYYGGLLEFYFPKIGVEFGGGMAGYLGSETYLGGLPLHTAPYIQTGLIFHDRPNSGNMDIWGKELYFQYYFNQEEWYNTFGIGMKWSFDGSFW